MAWGRFLLNDEVAHAVDLSGQRQVMQQLGSAFLPGHRRDELQEQLIWQLWTENVHLKLAINRLAALLLHRGVIGEQDVAGIVGQLQDMERGFAGS